MTQQLDIDFVSDVACPWCAVGLYSLEEALRRLGDAVSVRVRFRPFELDPDMGPEGEATDEYLARKYGATRSGAFLDPLADKVLAIGGLTCMWWIGRFPGWALSSTSTSASASLTPSMPIA